MDSTIFRWMGIERVQIVRFDEKTYFRSTFSFGGGLPRRFLARGINLSLRINE